MFRLTDFISKKQLEEFCQRNYIKKLSIFGSALENQLKSDSDIDILVEFDDKHIPGLMDIAGMEIELSEMLGRKIDLHTPEELSKYFRKEVVAKAKVEYAI